MNKKGQISYLVCTIILVIILMIIVGSHYYWVDSNKYEKEVKMLQIFCEDNNLTYWGMTNSGDFFCQDMNNIIMKQYRVIKFNDTFRLIEDDRSLRQ